jgi:hypothetical protein
MNDKTIRVIFWAAVAFFVIIIGTIFLGTQLAGNLPVINIFLPLVIIFSILGISLLVLTVKKKITGTIKKFLLLTGASAVGLPVFVILHNLVTAMLISLLNIKTEFDEPVFFILAIIVCPLGFLVGAIGTIIQIFKSKSGRLDV